MKDEVEPMNEQLSVICALPLFRNFTQEEVEQVLACIGSYVRNYRRGEFIALTEEPVEHAGVVLSGMVHLVGEDAWGERSILTPLEPGELFGGTLAWGNAAQPPFALYAAQDCQLLLLPVQRALSLCDEPCAFHRRLVQNMVHTLAEKNLYLAEKLTIVTQRTLRQKLLAYLSLQARRAGSDCFQIPLGRSELAEYLGADRSALTRELSRMRADGLLEYERRTFRILKTR